MAYILEETKGNLPLWLAPTQVKVLPVKKEYHLDYANEIYQLLLDEGFEVELDSRDEKLGYRIREAASPISSVYSIPSSFITSRNSFSALFHISSSYDDLCK